MTDATELPPFKIDSRDFEELEERIRAAFKRLLYQPLIAAFGKLHPLKLENARKSALRLAIEAGRVSYSGGAFYGKFSASVSKELKGLGAVWKEDRFALELSALPYDTRAEISASEARFQERMRKVDEALQKLLPDFPEKISKATPSADLFDSSLWKTDREIRKTLTNVRVLPDITPEEMRRISAEWQQNLDRSIRDFAADEIVSLRKAVQKSVFQGDRVAALAKEIKKSYGVTTRKAHFLARQETSLLLTKFKEARYTSAGIDEYRWGCVVGSKNHPVRPAHKKLEGKIFKWQAPPITTAPGEPVRRNNPGEDFNCRCFARPIVRRKTSA